jgi:hypothetical protein
MPPHLRWPDVAAGTVFLQPARRDAALRHESIGATMLRASRYRICHGIFATLAGILCCVQPAALAQGNGLIDDRVITIKVAKDVTKKRQQLINFIWGAAGMPTNRLPAVEKNDISPVGGLKDLERVDTLTISMELGQKSYGHHFIPKMKNNRLVVLHHGHAPSFDDARGLSDAGTGLQRTIDALLTDGYSVLAVYMPHIVKFKTRLTVNDVGSMTHDAMFQKLKVKDGSPMKFFLEPVAVCLHYLRTRAVADGFPVYKEINMVGLSGGGWTTTVYAAIDPTITLSFPVAGTIPLFLRSGGSVGDTEQFLPAFYKIAGYPELYVLGSYGPGRKQVQLLNRRDDCCFGERQHRGKLSYDAAMRDYEMQVRATLHDLGDKGSFRLEIDEAASAHTISWNAIVNTILAELNGGRPMVGAVSSTDAFVRGWNGHLWHHGPAGWKDTGLQMVGVPAVMKGVIHAYDIIYRNPSNQLMHAYPDGAAWNSSALRGVVINDPAAVSTQKGVIDIITVGGNYQLYHHRLTKKGVTPFQAVGVSKACQGKPVLVSRGPKQLNILFRGFDRGLYHAYSTGDPASWKLEAAGGTMLNFPAAVALPNGSLRCYVQGLNGKLFEATQIKNDTRWEWACVSDHTGGQLITGSPGAAAQGDVIHVFARSPSGRLSMFLFGKKWTFADRDRAITGSPTALPGSAFARGTNGGLLLYDGTKWLDRGSWFD